MKSKRCRNEWSMWSFIDMSVLAWQRHNFSSLHPFKVIVVGSIISIGLIICSIIQLKKILFSVLHFHADANSCQNWWSMEKKEMRYFPFSLTYLEVTPDFLSFTLISRTLIFIYFAYILHSKILMDPDMRGVDSSFKGKGGLWRQERGQNSREFEKKRAI